MRLGPDFQGRDRPDLAGGLFLVVSLAMANTKPFVAVACLCERAILETDGVVTLVRIIDTFTAQIPPNLPPNLKGSIPLSVFISVKSGDVTGEHQMGLRIRKPNEEPKVLRTWSVVLEGGVHGANTRLDVELGDPVDGLYWFDVLWLDEVLTSIPYRIKITEQQPIVAA